MRNVLVAGYYGFGNTGDEAILRSIIDTLRSLDPKIIFTVLSKSPAQTASTYGVNAVNRLSMKQVAAAIRRCDLLIFGGGSLIQDVTSLRSLAYYLWIIYYTKSLKKPVMIYANGFGPVRTRTGKFLTRLVLNRTDLITLRDRESMEELKSIGVKPDLISVTADPAFIIDAGSLDFPDGDRLLDEAGVPPHEGPRVLLCVRPWKEGNHIEAVAKAAVRLTDDLNCQVIFLPFHYAQDNLLGPKLYELSGRRIFCLGQKYAPNQILSIYSKVDLVLGMRLHSLIFAVIQAIPAVALVYDPKVESFSNLTGIPSAGCVTAITSDQIVESVTHALTNRSELAAAFKRLIPGFRQLAEENAKMVLKFLYDYN